MKKKKEKIERNSSDLSQKQNKNKSNVNFNIKIPKVIIVLFFLFITAVFFWDIIAGNAFFWEDFIEYVYPVQTFAANSSEIPFWNPFVFGGMPFLADIQVGFFYPLNRIFDLFVTSNHDLPLSIIQLITILHFFIALCSTYALMRSFKVSDIGSIISAISYAFSFNLVLQVIHPMLLAHLAWFPLVIMFLYKAVVKANLQAGILGGLIFGMSILSGHPQILLYEGLFLAIFALYHFIVNIKGNNDENSSNSIGRIAKSLIYGLLVFIIAVGIFQIQYQHTNELSKYSLRTEMTYEKASEGSLDVKQIFTALVPKMFGYEAGGKRSELQFQLPTCDANGKSITAPYYYYWETGFYFGLAAIILGLYGFLSIPISSNKHKLLFIITSIFGFIFALGSNGFIFGLFHELPLFENFRFPSRMMFFVTISFAVMTGFGFDRLTSVEKTKKELIKILGVLGIVLIAVLLVLSGSFISSNMQGNTSVVSDFATTALILILIIGAVIFIQYNKQDNKTLSYITGIGLIIITFLDLYIAGHDFNLASEDGSKRYAINEQQKKFFTPNKNNLFRVSMRNKDYGIIAMQRNIGMTSNIMLVEGYNPLVLNRYELPLKTREERNKLWNTKYEVTVDTTHKQVYFRDRAAENDFLPRAWMVSNFEIVDSNNIENYMLNRNIDYKEIVLLEKDINYTPTFNFDNNYKIDFVKYSNNNIQLTTHSNTGGILVLSEVFYPAWKAKIDGIETEIYRADYNFRAIKVPAGQHSIEMQYSSTAYANGRLITLITLIISLFGLIFASLSNKKKKNIS